MFEQIVKTLFSDVISGAPYHLGVGMATDRSSITVGLHVDVDLDGLQQQQQQHELNVAALASYFLVTADCICVLTVQGHSRSSTFAFSRFETSRTVLQI